MYNIFIIFIMIILFITIIICIILTVYFFVNTCNKNILIGKIYKKIILQARPELNDLYP